MTLDNGGLHHFAQLISSIGGPLLSTVRASSQHAQHFLSHFLMSLLALAARSKSEYAKLEIGSLKMDVTYT